MEKQMMITEPQPYKPLVSDDELIQAKEVTLRSKDPIDLQKAMNLALLSIVDEFRISGMNQAGIGSAMTQNMAAAAQQLGHIAAEMTTQRVMGGGMPHDMITQEVPAADDMAAAAKKPEEQRKPGQGGYL